MSHKSLRQLKFKKIQKIFFEPNQCCVFYRENQNIFRPKHTFCQNLTFLQIRSFFLTQSLLSHYSENDSAPHTGLLTCFKMGAPNAVYGCLKKTTSLASNYASTKFLLEPTKCTDEIRKSSHFVLPELCNRLTIARAKIL